MIHIKNPGDVGEAKASRFCIFKGNSIATIYFDHWPAPKQRQYINSSNK